MTGAALAPNGWARPRRASLRASRTRSPFLLAAAALSAGPLALALPGRAAAQWIEDPGSGWVDVRLYYHDTREEYGPQGARQDLFARGHAITRSVYVTAAVGIFRGIDAWLQVPVHDFTFADAGGVRGRTGFGDPRLYLRVGPSLFGLSTFPVAIRGGVKIPAVEFPVDAEIIPLTEGQTDWELYLEAGHSFYPAPVYAMGWIGYRWREAKGVERDPGDERTAYVAVGGDVGPRVIWKLAAEGLWGRTPLIERIAVENARRRILQIFPSVGVRLGPGAVDIGARIPLSGRNLPSGPALVLGYFFKWSLR